MLLFITREVARSNWGEQEGVGPEGAGGGMGSLFGPVVAPLFLLGTFTVMTSSLFSFSFHSTSNNLKPNKQKKCLPLVLAGKNYLPDISSLITPFTWQPRQGDASCSGEASGLQRCQVLAF